jgi:transposase-like protein
MPTTNRLTWEQKAKLVQELAARSESVTAVCVRWRISRECAYKWWRRYRDGGLNALRERPRRPGCQPRRLSAVWSERIAAARRRHPRWGARKLRALLRRQHPRARVPAASTIGAELRRLGCTAGVPRRPRGPEAVWAPRLEARRANDVWTVDFKGWFRTGDGARCDPLTMRDLRSRYGLCAHVLKGMGMKPVQRQFVRLFRRHGLPKVIRCDQGAPFGRSSPALLSRLSAWWVSLGIRPEFSRRARPGDNASHEQWHRELKAETASPPAPTLPAQQRRLDRWLHQYNHQRPHEAHEQRVPSDFYRRSPRPYAGPRPAVYPAHWAQRAVRRSGEIYWQGRRRFIGESFRGFRVGLRPSGRAVWRVYFYDVLLGELHDADTTGLRSARYRRPSG